jgi:hypothetical protein
MTATPAQSTAPYIETDTVVELSYEAVMAEIARLRAENQALLRSIRPPGYYEEHGVYTFKGKTAARREQYDLGLPCGCKAYREVLTVGRWRALGYLIRQGESACHRAGKSATIPLFCACQVEQAGPNSIVSVVVTDTQDIDSIPF